MSSDEEKPGGPGGGAAVSQTTGASESISRGESVTVTKGRSWAADLAALKERERQEQALLKAELARIAGDPSISAEADVNAPDPGPDEEIREALFTLQVAASELPAAVRAILQRQVQSRREVLRRAELAAGRTGSVTRHRSETENSG